MGFHESPHAKFHVNKKKMKSARAVNAAEGEFETPRFVRLEECGVFVELCKKNARPARCRVVMRKVLSGERRARISSLLTFHPDEETLALDYNAR